MQTAAVIIIGNEILSGKYADENGPFFIKRLRELGIRLARLVVISDELHELAEEVRRCSERFDLVFTTGGVGPTHDDITMVSVAAAFGVGLSESAELIALFERRKRGPINEAIRRMATLPEGAELIWSEDVMFPMVVMRNVHILPGVPSFMRLKFEAVAARWQGAPVHTARVETAEQEWAIAERLEQAVALWPGVEIGSYPRYEDKPYRVIITLEGQDGGAVDECHVWLAARLLPVDGPQLGD